MAAGAAAASAFGVAVALVTVRLRGDYLAIVTLGFAETLRIVMSNELWIANGTDGLSGIPGPFRGTLGPHLFNLFYLGIVVAAVIVLFFLVDRLAHAPFGRVLRAIRDDEQIAQVAGKNVVLFKVKAFGFGTAALGLAGALYGHFTSYIAPDLFAPLLTLYIKLSLLAGGLGNSKGAVLGAVLVVFFLESTRFIVPLIPGITAVQGAALRELMISVALLVILRFYAKGLMPGAHRASGLACRRRRAGSCPNMNAPWRRPWPLPNASSTMQDVAAVVALAAESADPQAGLSQAAERIAAETIGWRLFTVLRYVETAQAVERLYSSDEAAYPVGGRKPLSKITASHGAMERGEVFLAATKEDVRQAFFDHELIFSLGITAILNVPIRHAGRRLGTVNLCGEEGMYGPAEIARGKILAGLLVPALLMIAD